MPATKQRPPYTSLVVLAVFVFAAFALAHVWPETRGARRAPSSDFQKFGTLKDISFFAEGGKRMRLSDLRGRPVLLNLWATWCGPCVEEMPSLDRLQRDFPNLAVVAVSMDKEGEEKVRRFLEAEGLKHLQIFTDPSMASMTALDVPGLPATILIAADGTEAGGVSGAFDWDSDEAREAIRELTVEEEADVPESEAISVRNPRPPRVPSGVTTAEHRAIR